MSIFEDKVYQDMDWLSKVCEPIICNLNDVLNKLPNKIELTYDVFVKHVVKSYGPPSQLNIDNFMLTLIHELEWEDQRRILKCFLMQIEGDPILNLNDKTLTGGTVSIIKIKDKFEEKEIQELVGIQGLDKHLRHINHKGVPIERINNIVELLGLSEARRSRSPSSKITAIIREMENIMRENRWDIKDIALSNRVSLWLKRYIKDGNLAGYTNFCKLKVMTHNDAPIYSIEGEEEV